MTEPKDERIANLEAELEAAKKEAGEYFAAAQSTNRVAEKLLDLDDFRLQVQKQLQAHTHTHAAEDSVE